MTTKDPDFSSAKVVIVEPSADLLNWRMKYLEGLKQARKNTIRSYKKEKLTVEIDYISKLISKQMKAKNKIAA